jgi:hypothetical protein
MEENKEIKEDKNEQVDDYTLIKTLPLLIIGAFIAIGSYLLGANEDNFLITILIWAFGISAGGICFIAGLIILFSHSVSNIIDKVSKKDDDKEKND